MDKIILKLRLNYFLWLVLAVVVLVLFETECCMPGAWAGGEVTETSFLIQTFLILLTICVIPVSLKLLNWKPVRKRIQVAGADRMPVYLRWSALRCALLGLFLILNLLVYYAALEKANALCAVILLLAYLFCWPSANKIKSETEVAE